MDGTISTDEARRFAEWCTGPPAESAALVGVEREGCEPQERRVACGWDPVEKIINCNYDCSLPLAAPIYRSTFGCPWTQSFCCC